MWRPSKRVIPLSLRCVFRNISYTCSCTSSDSSGFYSLTGFGSGSYLVTPSRANQSSASNGFSSLDASRIAQHLAGLITLNSNQLIAADTTGNGTVSSLDAAYIAQFLVGTAPRAFCTRDHTADWGAMRPAMYRRRKTPKVSTMS